MQCLDVLLLETVIAYQGFQAVCPLGLRSR